MVIRPKDTAKLFGVLVMAFCAVFVCVLFMNYNLDMARIEDRIVDAKARILYDAQVASGKIVSAVSGGALLLTSVVMLFFYITHYIDIHRAELGILKALGYSNLKIAKEFWVFGLSVFIGTAAGFSAFAMMPAFYKQQTSSGLLPDVPLHFNPVLVLHLVLLPTLAFALLAIGYGLRKLRRPALELIRGKGGDVYRAKTQKSERNKALPFLQRLKQSTVRSRFSLVFFIGFSAFCYADAIQMSASMSELSSRMMAALIFGICVVLAFTTLFLAVTTVFKANAKTIAMLRVFGYSDRECGRAILNGYRPVAYIGFASGTIYQYELLKIMTSTFWDQTAVEIPKYEFDVRAFVVSLISFIVIYELVMRVYSARMKRISLSQIMQAE